MDKSEREKFQVNPAGGREEVGYTCKFYLLELYQVRTVHIQKRNPFMLH